MAVKTTSDLLARANGIRLSVALGAVTPSTVGALIRDLIDSILSPASEINPMQYGAIGDGSTSDNAALLNAISAAVSAGVPVNGRGKTYGVAGNLVLISGTWLKDITFKQLTPGAAGDVRTLTSSGVNNLKFERVKVDRNGNGTNGAVNDDAGIYLDGGSGHYFEDVEVFGNDMGTGVSIHNATNFDMVRTHVHDMLYVLGADPGDDRVQGIWLNGCSRFRNIEPKAHDLGGNFGTGATTKYSRGMVYSGCSDFTVLSPQAWNVDQGHDVSGSSGNVRFAINGGLMSDCYTWGFKFANSARDGTITGAVAVRCGQGGFVASGPGDAISVMTGDLDFVGCEAYDTGSNGVWATTSGFRIIEGALGAAGSPRGIRFLSCKAHDRQGVPTMDYGYLSNVPANTDGRYNECIDCRTLGAGTAETSGINESYCAVSFNAAQSIANNAWQGVNWDIDVDLGEMHSTSVNTSNIVIRRAGKYRVTYGASFAANATGQRGVSLYKNGVQFPGGMVLVNAASAGETSLNVAFTIDCAVGTTLLLGVFQNSGGALNLQTSSSGVVEQLT